MDKRTDELNLTNKKKIKKVKNEPGNNLGSEQREVPRFKPTATSEFLGIF